MPRETVGEWSLIPSEAQGIVSSGGEGPPSKCRGKPLANMRADEVTQPTGLLSSCPSSSSQLTMVAEQDSRVFGNPASQLSALAAQSSAQISANQSLDPQDTMRHAQQMKDEVRAEQMRVEAAAEPQQQLAYQKADSQPQDDPMTNHSVVGGLPKSNNIGTPPTGSTGVLVPRATAGVYSPVLQSLSGKGRRSSPRTPGGPPGVLVIPGSPSSPRYTSTLSLGLLESRVLLWSYSSSG